MTRAQARRIQSIARKIADLASRATDILNDDPMEGEVWVAFNRIASDANYAEDLAGFAPTQEG